MDFRFQKQVKQFQRGELDESLADLEYWLSRPPAERLAAVEHLREQHYGAALRFQRISAVVKRVQR